MSRKNQNELTMKMDLKKITFKYMIPFANHFDYRHMVDDRNGIRYQVPSLEQIGQHIDGQTGFSYFKWQFKK